MALAEIVFFPRSKDKDREKVIYVDTYAISPNPNQPRKAFDPRDIDELAESVKSCGIIQPLIIRAVDGRYELIAGERRLRAAKQAGLKEVPCILSQADDKKSSLMALTENVQRKNLDYFEEAQGIERIICQSGMTQEHAAAKLGKSQSYIANKLRLLRLDPECAALIRGAGLSERHARALLTIGDPETRMAALRKIISCAMKVEDAERYVQALLLKKSGKGQTLKPIIKDIRLMMNTINRAVDLVKKAGIDAACEREETEKEIKVMITIPKN